MSHFCIIYATWQIWHGGGYTEGDNTAAALDIMRKQILSTKACKHIRLVTQNKKMNPKKRA